ncbi:hypothetical protein PYK79_18560 [Streptomyces sp. ID05-04B]|uniref:hypothetical protein n=1 Tax=unclassified Streptomyces TaxID=2593676 RepID=UPI00131F1CC9|nr:MULTISPECIES: hypothetical protein [unclassified Streptomyces]MDX5564968.1 hypothetical protein [Streptomyces sp. ID05-04B]
MADGDLGTCEGKLVATVAEAIRGTGDHRCAVAVPARRDGRSVATVDDLGHLVDMGLQVPRTVHVGRPVRFQPGQGHRLDAVTASTQLGGDRAEHPAALPTAGHHHEPHRATPWA